MKKFTVLLFLMAFISIAYGEVSVGVDVFNRYVWRGTDYGNSASVQPTLEYSSGVFTVGAWGAWSTTGAPGGNENDLYISTHVGPVALTVTDYFFPSYAGGDDILSLGNHIIELSAGMERQLRLHIERLKLYLTLIFNRASLYT